MKRLKKIVCLCILAMLLIGVLSITAAAQDSDLTVSLGRMVLDGEGNCTFPETVVQGSDKASQLTLSVTGSDVGNSKITAAVPEGFTADSTNTDVYKVFTCASGADAAAVQSWLRTVRFYCDGKVTVTVSVKRVAQTLPENMYYCPETENYYYLSTAKRSWIDAYNDAQSAEYNGLKGHLVTVTSKAENDFVYSIVVAEALTAGTEPIHLGATREILNDPNTSNASYSGSQRSNFLWACGPEEGTLPYTCWAWSEPNNYGGRESTAAMNAHAWGIPLGEEWSDVAKEDNFYYIIEFENDDSCTVTYADTTAPQVVGVEDGKTYCVKAEFTVTEENLDTVKSGEKVLSPNEEGIYILEPGIHALTVTDKAENTTALTVAVNEKHTPVEDDEDCTTAVACEVCGGTAVAAKVHDFTGIWQKDVEKHWHVCGNTGCVVTDTKTTHSALGDSDCTTADLCVCGAVVTEAKAEHVLAYAPNHDGTHTNVCENCDYEKKEACSGGTATCTAEAVCAKCGAAYGGLSDTNHSYSDQWSKNDTEHWHQCSCGDKADLAAHAYGDWAVIKVATIQEEGIKEKTCLCGHAVREVIPKEPLTPATGDTGWAGSFAVMILSACAIVWLSIDLKRKKTNG